MIEIKDKSRCCGCSACMSVCPKNAIEMKEDSEGFLYPEVDKDKCIDCGLCEKVCPIKNAKENKKEKHAFIFQHKDDDVRRQSTSGGAFTAIAEYVIKNNGIVFGVAFDSEYNVVHTSVNNKDDLYKFRNSKYVQSDKKETYKETKRYLDNEKLVLYSGTSCEIEGLKRYLGKEYENLITVDVVCRAVPSPLVWKKYLKLKQQQCKDIKSIYFRDKYYGYKYSNLSIYNKNNDKKQEYHSGVESDPYLRAFFSNICDRPSCYNCKFKKENRESDITIWDCFEVEKYDKSFDDDKGTSRIMTNSSKGLKIINELAKSNNCKEIEVDRAINGFLAMHQPVKENSKRKEFFDDLQKLEGEKLFQKYFPDTLKIKLERKARKILLKTGIYKKILNLGKKIRKRD